MTAVYLWFCCTCKDAAGYAGSIFIFVLDLKVNYS